MPDEMQPDRLFADGVAALRAGDAALARQKLLQVVEQDRGHEQGWLWLSAAVETAEERIVCLENVLRINPRSEAARRGLEALGAPAPPLPSEPPAGATGGPSTVYHGIPHAVDDELNALLTGAPRPVQPVQPAADGSWRAALYALGYTSEASIVGSKDAQQPSSTVGDLLRAWQDIALLYPRGAFGAELDHGPVGHIALNIAAGGLLNIIAVLIGVLTLLVLPAAGFRPPLITSTADWLAQAPDTHPRETSGAFGATSEALSILGLPDPADVAARLAADAQTTAEQRLASLLSSPGLLLLTYAFLVTPALAGSLGYYVLFINGISNFYSGKGNVLQTFHALSIGLVIVQGASVALAVVMPLLPLGVALVAGAIVGVYQLTVLSVALGQAQQMDLLLSLGMLITGVVLGSVVLVLLFGGVAWLAGRVAGL